jgi:DNA polymerase delta subunit 1
MLMAWQKFFVEVDPDIVIGYNITQFDIHYMLERAWVLELKEFPFLGRIKCMSGFQSSHEVSLSLLPASPQRYNFRTGRPNFHVCPGYDGRLVLDLFHHIREHHTGLQGEGAYKLNGVSLQFLGEKKEDINYQQIPELQNGDADSRRDLAIYCLKVSIPFFFFSTGWKE